MGVQYILKYSGPEIDAKLDSIEDKIYAVNITMSNNSTTGTSDKTATEIKAAADAGKMPILYTSLDNQTIQAHLSSFTTSNASFIYNNLLHENNLADIGRFNINTSGSVDIIWQSYAELSSPAFTGIPTAPTAATSTNSTQVATTAFVQSTLVSALGSIETALDALL